MADQVQTILASMKELTELARQLSSGLAEQIRKLRVVQRWQVGFSLLKAAIIVAMLLQQREINRLSHVAAENAARLAVMQQLMSGDVLCPFYGLMLKSYNPTSTAAREAKFDYEASFAVIERGAQTLGCAVTKRGGR